MKIRQNVRPADPDDAEPMLIGISRRYGAGELPAHKHTHRAQLIYAGRLVLLAGWGAWVFKNLVKGRNNAAVLAVVAR